MVAFFDLTYDPKQREKCTKQLIKELENAIQDNTDRLEEVGQRRLRAEEEKIKCTRETERRADLMVEKTEAVEWLQELGSRLQEEKHLSEQLNGQTSADRNQRKELQQRSECLTDKESSLAAVILEVKQSLAEAKARNMAAQASICAPTSKSKRRQNKPN